MSRNSFYGPLMVVSILVIGLFVLKKNSYDRLTKQQQSEAEVAVSETSPPVQLLSLNTVEEGNYIVIEMDNASIPDYVALEVVGVSGNRYCLAREGEGLKISDKVRIRKIRIGNEFPCFLAEKVR